MFTMYSFRIMAIIETIVAIIIIILAIILL